MLLLQDIKYIKGGGHDFLMNTFNKSKVLSSIQPPDLIEECDSIKNEIEVCK